MFISLGPLKKKHTLNTQMNLFIHIAAFSDRHNTTTKLPFTVFTDLCIMNSEVRSFPGKMKTWRETKSYVSTAKHSSTRTH